MDFLKAAGAVVVGLIVIVALGFGLNYAGLLNARFFAPRVEQVRHDTFECSASHADGMVRELRQIRDQYRTADAAGRAALADTFKHDADGFTCYELPADLQSFYSSIR
jgi:hypothetical protein